MKRTVEIDDTLNERVQDAIAELQGMVKEKLRDDPTYDLNGLWEDLQDEIGEIVNNNTPIYNGEIADLWYCHGDILEEAYENASIEGNSLRQVAIYCYIEQEIVDWWFEEAEGWIDQWRAENGLQIDNDDDES